MNVVVLCAVVLAVGSLKELNKPVMRNEKGYKITKGRDYARQPSLMETLQQSQTLSQAQLFYNKAENAATVNNKTLKKMRKWISQNEERLKGIEQAITHRQHMAKFYGMSNQR